MDWNCGLMDSWTESKNGQKGTAKLNKNLIFVNSHAYRGVTKALIGKGTHSYIPARRISFEINTRIKNLSFRPKFYGKTKVKWVLIKSDHCFGFGKTMIWLNECSLLFVLPQKFGPEAEILDSCIVITVDFKRNSSGTRISEYAPPPPN